MEMREEVSDGQPVHVLHAMQLELDATARGDAARLDRLGEGVQAHLAVVDGDLDRVAASEDAVHHLSPSPDPLRADPYMTPLATNNSTTCAQLVQAWPPRERRT